MTKIIGKYSSLKEKCRSIGNENEPGSGTGDLVSIGSRGENDAMTWHMRNVTCINPDDPPEVPKSFYYPWAYIGLRKGCSDCTWHWQDGQPLAFNNWYTGQPSPTSNECGWARVTLPHFGQWYAYSCSSSYPGYCEYYPLGLPPVFSRDISMPTGGSCKEGWWRFAGYCYKVKCITSRVLT